jgi:hypothetical protein
MTDVRQQLTEALDEVERIARAALADAPAPWSVDLWANAGMLKNANGDDLWDCEGSPRLAMQAAVATHAARWDPATVLRLVERDRALLATNVSAQASLDEKVRAFDSRKSGELIAATARCKAITEQLTAAAAFWVGTPEVDR